MSKQPYDDGYSLVMPDGYFGVRGQTKSALFTYLQIAHAPSEYPTLFVVEYKDGEPGESVSAKRWLAENPIIDNGQGFYAMDLRKEGHGMVFYCCPTCADIGVERHGKRYGFAEAVSTPKLFGDNLPDQWCRHCGKQILVRGSLDLAGERS